MAHLSLETGSKRKEQNPGPCTSIQLNMAQQKMPLLFERLVASNWEQVCRDCSVEVAEPCLRLQQQHASFASHGGITQLGDKQTESEL